MSAVIAASAVRTSLGDGDETFAGLCAGRCAVSALGHPGADRTGVVNGYHVAAGDDGARTPGEWLAGCVAAAVAQAGLDLGALRVSAVVGTGLRALAHVEHWQLGDEPLDVGRLDLGAVVRAVVPSVREVVTVSNACSAGGHALALAQDLLDLDRADAVIVGAADGMTISMLAMIGRLADAPAEQVRPFDRARGGALLGEGAAAMVLVRERSAARGAPLGRVLATGLSCDATHETRADLGGVRRALADAFDRAGRTPDDVGLIVAHGTGTAINDPLECQLIAGVYEDREVTPPVTAIKGAIGHTSGAAALMSADVALRCLRERLIPPVIGLRHPIAEATWMPLIDTRPLPADARVAQVNAFGFGGVNAITLLERADAA